MKQAIWLLEVSIWPHLGLSRTARTAVQPAESIWTVPPQAHPIQGQFRVVAGILGLNRGVLRRILRQRSPLSCGQSAGARPQAALLGQVRRRLLEVAEWHIRDRNFQPTQRVSLKRRSFGRVFDSITAIGRAQRVAYRMAPARVGGRPLEHAPCFYGVSLPPAAQLSPALLFASNTAGQAGVGCLANHGGTTRASAMAEDEAFDLRAMWTEGHRKTARSRPRATASWRRPATLTAAFPKRGRARPIGHSETSTMIGGLSQDSVVGAF